MSKKEIKPVEPNSISIKVSFSGYSSNVASFNTELITVVDGVEKREMLAENGDIVRTVARILNTSARLATGTLSDITPERK